MPLTRAMSDYSLRLTEHDLDATDPGSCPEEHEVLDEPEGCGETRCCTPRLVVHLCDNLTGEQCQRRHGGGVCLKVDTAAPQSSHKVL